MLLLLNSVTNSCKNGRQSHKWDNEICHGKRDVYMYEDISLTFQDNITTLQREKKIKTVCKG